jgi:hypothetical protein
VFCPVECLKSRKMAIFFRSPQSTWEYVRLRCHCTRHKVRVSIEISFSGNILGGLVKVYPSVKRATSSKRLRRKIIRSTTIIERNCFTDDELYRRQKFGFRKKPTCRNCAVLNLSHAVAFRCVTTANDF